MKSYNKLRFLERTIIFPFLQTLLHNGVAVSLIVSLQPGSSDQSNHHAENILSLFKCEMDNNHMIRDLQFNSYLS